MSIEKMMCLSTAHITAETARQLGDSLELLAIEDPNERPAEPDPWVSQLIVYPHGEYGWLICIAGDALNHMVADGADEQLPKELLKVIRYADSKGCDWLLLDCDAEETTALPSFDW